MDGSGGIARREGADRSRLLRRASFVAVAALALVAAVVAGFVLARPAGEGTAGSRDTAAGDTSSAAPVAAASDLAKSAPTSAPAPICRNSSVLDGPATPPAGARRIPAGNNANLSDELRTPGVTFWFAPGVHTLERSEYAQIQPGKGSRFVGGPGAILDGQNANLYAFTGTATDVTIEHLTVRDFGTGASNNDQGVVNHDRGARWTMRNNTFVANDGAAVMLGSGNVLSRNCLRDNGQYGFSAFPAEGSTVVTDVKVDRNEISGNNTDDWERRREGCGCTGGGKFWQVDGADVTGNYVHDNRGPGMWADNDNREFLFQGNLFADNDGNGIEYEVSYNFAIRGNTFLRNAIHDGRQNETGGDTFPSGAIYVSESGGDPRAGKRFAASEITGNLFQDNWDGVVLWENADRFCRPGEEFDTTNGCPWFDRTWGVRYRTQNVRISGNDFRMDRVAVGCLKLCGRQALISNWGTYPDNSPYKERVVQDAITFRQHNVWRGNRYTGDWMFMPHDTDQSLNWAAWRSAPYGQDAGSTFS